MGKKRHEKFNTKKIKLRDSSRTFVQEEEVWKKKKQVGEFWNKDEVSTSARKMMHQRKKRI